MNAYSAILPIGGKGITREFIVIHLRELLIPRKVLLKGMKLALEELRPLWKIGFSSVRSKMVRIHFWIPETCLLQCLKNK